MRSFNFIHHAPKCTDSTSLSQCRKFSSKKSPNALTRESQILVLRLLSEGLSISAINRLTEVARNTVTGLQFRFGTACKKLLDFKLRGLKLQRLQLDEIYESKTKFLDDDGNLIRQKAQCVFVAIGEDSRLVPSYLLATGHGRQSADPFLLDLAGRIICPKGEETIRISTDGNRAYPGAIKSAFGKYYRHRIKKGEHWGTSYIERNHLSIRNFVAPLRRLTLAYSKKPQNLDARLAMHFVRHNFCWTVKDVGCPAVVAGVIENRWSFDELWDSLHDRWPELVFSRKRSARHFDLKLGCSI